MRRSWQTTLPSLGRGGLEGDRPSSTLDQQSRTEVQHIASIPTAHRRSRKFPLRYCLPPSKKVAVANLQEIATARCRVFYEETVYSVLLSATGLGAFGRVRDATLWLGIEKNPQLMDLAARVREELSARGLAYDEKDFLPHVTLARRVRMPRGALGELAFPLPDEAARVTLFRSILSSEGARYKPLYTVGLLGQT